MNTGKGEAGRPLYFILCREREAGLCTLYFVGRGRPERFAIGCGLCTLYFILCREREAGALHHRLQLKVGEKTLREH